MYKFLALTVLLMIVALPVNAAITRDKVEAFNQDYTRMYESCNFQNIRDYMDAHFSTDYLGIFTGVDETGQVQKVQITKQDFLNQSQQTLDMMKASNLVTDQCNTSVNVQSMEPYQNGYIVHIIQSEEAVLKSPRGQTIPVKTGTNCKHYMIEDNNRIMITRSECTAN